MVRLEIKAAAKSDLADILAYSVEQFGQEVAEAYLRGFYEAFDKLKSYPEMGVLVPKITPATRSLLHRRHRIFYRYDANIVVIERIMHFAMDARSRLN